LLVNTNLYEANAIVIGEKTPWDVLISSDFDSSDDQDGAQEVESEGEQASQEVSGMASTELEQICADVVEIITSLFRLSMNMRKPAAHERFSRAPSLNASHFYEFDKDHVRNKFPNAKDFLCTRLGRANSQRRQFFQYRRSHHEKLACDILSEDDETGTTASSVPSDFKDTHLPEVVDLEPEQDRLSDQGMSETSYASSTADSTGLKVPSLPESFKDGTPYECPLCREIVSVQSRKAWK
jgi:hypothetical protein